MEMTETAQILSQATSKSLVIMDEVGRGTSTKDGLSLAYAIIEHLSKHCKSLTLFATHYHELAPLLAGSDFKIGYRQAMFDCDGGVCMYKIKPGIMTESHGIDIAMLAGLPTSVIKSATKTYRSL